jgi:NAD(P)-dependent dehydrogenase (short-subunit alcohol dehydrogenase family)
MTSASLVDRRALVTGAAHGIGRRVAERLVDRGMRSVLLDVDPSVRSLADDLGAEAVVVDLTDATGAREALDETAAADPFWLLVNNAGVFTRASVLESSIDEWDHVQQVNARSMLVTMQATVPGMIERGRGGRVVNMASMAAKRGTAGEAAYAASKAAVVALTRIAALELGPSGITVNAVCPGYVLTDLGADSRTEADVARWAAMSPLGRLADPDDIAGVVEFLASDDAAYLTGQAVNVTGGMCMS